MKFEHCTPTKIHKELVKQCVFDYGCPQTRAAALVKRALGTDAIRAAIAEQVGEYLADEAAVQAATASVASQLTGGTH